MLRFLRGATKRTKTIWWVLIFVTVVTFLGGFVFLLGSGLSSTGRARQSGAIGVVQGASISRVEYQNALTEQRAAYRQQFGIEPADRDLRMIELQTWRSLVNQRLLGHEARKEGIQAYDGEVLLMMQAMPPQALMSAPVFQTEGQFDPAKYQAALRDPNNNWAPFEEMTRQQLPVRKLQERLLASLKMSEPELLDLYHQRFDRVMATVVQIPPETSAEPAKLTDADLKRAYDRNKHRFAANARTDAEALIVAKAYGEAETKAARETARDLANRARRGEDFAALARDYSEGPGAAQGGVVNRSFQPSEFGEAGPVLASLPPGGVTDPYPDGSRFVVFQRLAPDSTTPPGAIRVAQIVIRVRPNEDQLRKQYEDLERIRTQAVREGIGKAATAVGLASQKTGYFNLDNPPALLYAVPQAVDWAVGEPKGKVSPIFEGQDEFVIVQVATQEPAGVASMEEVGQPIRQIAEVEARVLQSKPRADAIAAAIKGGASLEQAAQQAGVTPYAVAGMTRLQPDPRLGGSPEVVGALFGARPGQVLGPFQTLGGWVFARVDASAPADTTAYAAMKGQILTEVLQRRQQSFFTGYVTALRHKAKVKDLRAETGL